MAAVNLWCIERASILRLVFPQLHLTAQLLCKNWHILRAILHCTTHSISYATCPRYYTRILLWSRPCSSSVTTWESARSQPCSNWYVYNSTNLYKPKPGCNQAGSKLLIHCEQHCMTAACVQTKYESLMHLPTRSWTKDTTLTQKQRVVLEGNPASYSAFLLAADPFKCCLSMT